MLIVQVTVNVSPAVTLTALKTFLANIPSVPVLVSLNNPASVIEYGPPVIEPNDLVIVATEAPVEPTPDVVALTIGDYAVGHRHYIVRVVDALDVALGGHGNARDLGAWLDAKLSGNLTG